MTQREKLINLIYNTQHMTDISEVADHLFANGVIVLPCKVGDVLYYIGSRANGKKIEKYVKEEAVEMISKDGHSIYAHVSRALLIDLADLGKTVFLTREEAEAALKECKNNDKD